MPLSAPVCAPDRRAKRSTNSVYLEQQAPRRGGSGSERGGYVHGEKETAQQTRSGSNSTTYEMTPSALESKRRMTICVCACGSESTHTHTHTHTQHRHTDTQTHTHTHTHTPNAQGQAPTTPKERSWMPHPTKTSGAATVSFEPATTNTHIEFLRRKHNAHVAQHSSELGSSDGA